jgi:hypothetical protein
MNINEQHYIDLVEQCYDLIRAYDKKLYEPDDELNGHHYLAREEKTHNINRNIEAIRRLLT